jgi:hypothetical protein
MSKKRSIPDVFAELREIVGDAFDGDISDIRGMECTRSPAMTSEQTERMSEADWSGHVDADGNVLSWEYANQLYADNKQLTTDLTEARSQLAEAVAALEINRIVGMYVCNEGITHEQCVSLLKTYGYSEDDGSPEDWCERRQHDTLSRLTASPETAEGEYVCIHCKRSNMPVPNKICGLCKGHPANWRNT